jgi:hypothetical protein
MNTQPRTPAKHPFVSVAVKAAALLVGSTIAFAQQQTAPTQSTQPATNGAADPLAAIGQHPAIPTTDDIRQARFERLERMDALRGQTPPSNTALDRSATTSLLTSAQRQTMLRSLDTMDLRLDHTTAMLDTATGAQCNNALLAVVQKLASQLDQMRQVMRAPELATTFDNGVGDQAIFITPSSLERRENWRRQQLDQAAAYAGYPQASTRPVEPATPPTSGLDAQAQSRRSGEAQEPVTTP